MADNELKSPENTSDVKVTQATGSSRKPSRMERLRGKGTIIIVLLVLVAIAGGAYLYDSNKSETEEGKATGAYAYDYKNLETFNFSGTQEGRGMTFQKLPEMNPVGSGTTPTRKDFVQLTSNQNGDNSLVDIGVLSAAVRDFPNPPSEKYLKAVADYFSKPSDSTEYQEVIAPVQQFAQSGFKEPSVKVTLGRAQDFNNGNVTANSWIFDVTATDAGGINPSHSGKVIYMNGKNTYYMFLITAASNNWQAGSNSKIFQQIIDSIKIDQ
jgi:hypothetical protein